MDNKWVLLWKYHLSDNFLGRSRKPVRVLDGASFERAHLLDVCQQSQVPGMDNFFSTLRFRVQHHKRQLAQRYAERGKSGVPRMDQYGFLPQQDLLRFNTPSLGYSFHAPITTLE